MKLYKTNILFNINKIVYTIVILNFLIFFSSNSNAQISSGTYTIGGTSPDYANFTAAVNDLNTNGVAGDGPVTFNIRNGTYTEIFTINQITNVSLTSNVVFQSENQDSTLVTLTNSSATTLVLNGADYITFKLITIQTTGSKRVVELIAGATNNKFLNCRLNGYTTTGTSTSYAIVYSTSTATLDNNNEYRNNVFSDGSYGIVLLGSSSYTETGTVITGNEFVTQGGYGLKLNYNDGLIITNNTFNRHTSTTAYYGMYLNYCDGKSMIKKNKIWNTSGYGWGIRFYQSKSTSGNESEIFNNFITISGTTGNGYGLRLEYGEYVKVYNNNVHSSHTTTSTSAATFYASGSTTTAHYDIRNNIFENFGGGYAVYISNTTGLDYLNYNDYYSTGTNIGKWGSTDKTDMSAWTSATGETNSLNLDPSYTDAANGNLHIGNSSLEGVGINIAAITDDIDGTARPDPPTIGAHETGTATGPVITVVGALTAYETSVGTPTSAQTFTVEGSNLTNNILVTAPSHFQVQKQGVGPWASSVPLTESGGTVSLTTIEVRYNPSSADSHNGNVACSSTGATTKNIAAQGISTNCSGAFQGTYTINPGLAASCNNYQTISDAVSDLLDGTRNDDNCYYQGPGINGTICFNIANGTYNEQIKIKNISGTYDSIIFKSASGNYNDVTIEYSCPQDGDINNYVLRLDGAQYVTIRNLTIQSVGAGSTYTKVIDITGDAHNNKITNNNLISKTTTSQSNDRKAVVASSSDFNNDNNQVSNNVLTNGSHGVYFSGKAFNNLESGILILNNTITNSWFTGIHFQNQNAPIAKNNYITTNSTRTDFKGIYGYYTDNGLKIQKNQIYTTSAYGYGIYLYYCDGTAGNYGETSNNMVYIGSGGSTTNYGIQLNVSDYQKVYYNSAVSNSSSTLNSGELNCAFKSYNTNNNQIIKNNIFVNADAGLAIFVDIAASIEELDYNDLYTTTGSVLGRWVTTSSADATLASWQSITPATEDENSISADPLFTSNTDLHILESSPCIDKAIDVADVTDDIDNESRATDIGADEYGSGVQPVELLFFTAKVNKKESVVLKWKTASEINNDYFTVEKSVDCANFELVDIIKGAGNSNIILYYETYDNKPYIGTNYYRLKQTDYDGNYKYSDIRMVYIPLTNDKISIYPNPIKDNINIQINADEKTNVSIEIIDINGRIVYNRNKNLNKDNNLIEINVSNLNSSVYFVKILNNKGYILFTKKISVIK
jgi:parallel beta-helix repeat protein